MTPKDILNKAADWLEENAWCQNSLCRRGGISFNRIVPDAERCCLNGAIYMASGLDLGRTKKNQIAAISQAFDLVEKSLGTRNPARWNDTKGRTKQEVIAALRKAAK